MYDFLPLDITRKETRDLNFNDNAKEFKLY